MKAESNPSSWTEIICRQCGGKREVRRCYVERGQMKYCSKKCSSAARRTRGLEPVEYKGETFTLDGNGYFLERKTGRMLHRVIWEDNHGTIPEGYKVYHRDRNRSNYQIENLYLKEMNSQAKCDEAGCQEKILARGLCARHYQQLMRRKRRRLREAALSKPDLVDESSPCL
jgi:hypothetical protein